MLLWRKHPNGGRLAAVAVPADDSAKLQARGWLKINGHRAAIVGLEQHEPLTGMDSLLICFDEPYPDPHP